MTLAEVIKIKEDELRLIKDHEVAVVYDTGGNIIVEEHGGSSSVDLSMHLDRIRNVGGSTLLHNHPLGWHYPPSDPRYAGGSFSPEDIATACYAELVEIRAIGPVFAYTMRPGDGLNWSGDYWGNAVAPSLEKHKAIIIRSTLQAVAAGVTSREIAEADFWHQVWLRVAVDLSWGYTRLANE